MRTEEVPKVNSKCRCSFQILKHKENTLDLIVNLGEPRFVSFSNKEKRNYFIYYFLIKVADLKAQN